MVDWAEETEKGEIMKATFVLIASNEIENMAKKVMLEAHQKGGLGFEMARLPHHVSLKQPFIIDDLDEIERYFDEFVSTMKPISVNFEEITLWPSKVFGYDSGVMVIQAEKTKELYDLHIRLNKELEERYGLCPAEFDGEAYTFHMTLAIGGKPFENYQKAYELLDKKVYDQEVEFNQLGLLYYDSDTITPGTYFCYKRVFI